MIRLSYANVVSTAALLLATTGTAVAAHHYLITSSSQIKPGVIAVSNLNKRTIAALRGARGPKGDAGRRGANGDPGMPGAPGDRGPSNGYYRHTNDTVVIDPNGGTAVISTPTLPAGSYIITATAAIAIGAPPTGGFCSLTDGGSLHGPSHRISMAAANRNDVALTWGVTLASATSIQLFCTVDNGATGSAGEPQITAIRVATGDFAG